jgi:integrase
MALLWPGQEQRMKTKYPGIETMSDGRKRIRVRAVNPKSGRMQEVDKLVQVTLKEAIQLREEWKAGIQDADLVAREIPRLRDYVESWLKSRALSVKASTAITYAEALAHYVLPDLGEFFIDKITDGDVKAWQIGLSQRLGAGTVNSALIMLRMVLADAIAEYRLPHNPVSRVKRLAVSPCTDEEPNLLTAEELGKVLAAFKEHEPESYPLAITLALTGERYGEATAMKWGDLDEVAGVIRVRRSQWRGIVGTTKTGTVRSVPLVPELQTVLREHRARLASSGISVLDSDWVFPGEDGGLLPRVWLRWALIRVLTRVGITKRVTTHGLRRTFNNLSRQVAGEIVTRSITGHVTAAMTEHYSHVGSEEKLAAAGSIVRMVMGTNTEEKSGGSGGGSNACRPDDTRSLGPNLPN